jgi:transposase
MDPGSEAEVVSGLVLSLARSELIEVGRRSVLEVEEWAEIRRLHFGGGLSVRELARRTGRWRNTIRRALRSEDAPRYVRRAGRSILDPFKEEIQRLLREDPRLPGIRVFELIAEQGYWDGKTLVYDYLVEVRPFYLPRPRTFQRTSYRPGEIRQFDLWEPRREVPVGFGQTRRGWVVACALGFSRAGAGTLVFSKEATDILAGVWRAIERLDALPATLVTDREGSLHAGGGRPSEPFARFCGQLRVGWHICAPGDAQAKGLVERLIGFLETSFEPGREYLGPLDFQDQLDGWFAERANRRLHRTLRQRPVDLLCEERERMRPLPAEGPDTDRRWVTRVPADPHVRVDTNDYSLDPRLVGRRVELRISPREVLAVALDTGELAARHERCFAATARSPRSITPACWASYAALSQSQRSRPVRWPATTG